MDEQNPTPVEENLQPTPVSQWKGAVQVQGTVLRLPSDNACLVKQMSPTAFLQSGLIPDPLTAMMRKAIHTGQGLNPKDLEKIAEDPDTLADAMMMVDRVVAHCVLEPVVSMPPVCKSCQHYFHEGKHKDDQQHLEGYHPYQEADRNPNILYADMLDMEDKMFIMQFVMGGVRELEPFRQEQGRLLESLQELEDMASTSVGSPGSD